MKIVPALFLAGLLMAGCGNSNSSEEYLPAEPSAEAPVTENAMADAEAALDCNRHGEMLF